MEMGKFVPQLMRYFNFEWASEKHDWEVKTYFFAKQHGLKFKQGYTLTIDEKKTWTSPKSGKFLGQKAGFGLVEIVQAY
ncbi:hypothetical protein ACHAPT_006414 [Fusarium lateritium]